MEIVLYPIGGGYVKRDRELTKWTRGLYNERIDTSTTSLGIYLVRVGPINYQRFNCSSNCVSCVLSSPVESPLNRQANLLLTAVLLVLAIGTVPFRVALPHVGNATIVLRTMELIRSAVLAERACSTDCEVGDGLVTSTKDTGGCYVQEGQWIVIVG